MYITFKDIYWFIINFTSINLSSYLAIHLAAQGSVSGNTDVMILQVFAATADESKLRARPRPPATETA